jgi:hypothetical protein
MVANRCAALEVDAPTALLGLGEEAADEEHLDTRA